MGGKGFLYVDSNTTLEEEVARIKSDVESINRGYKAFVTTEKVESNDEYDRYVYTVELIHKDDLKSK